MKGPREPSGIPRSCNSKTHCLATSFFLVEIESAQPAESAESSSIMNLDAGQSLSPYIAGFAIADQINGNVEFVCARYCGRNP
jgi:hypothetical protein